MKNFAAAQQAPISYRESGFPLDEIARRAASCHPPPARNPPP
jgi:hypothetical protein